MQVEGTDEWGQEAEHYENPNVENGLLVAKAAATVRRRIQPVAGQLALG